VIDADPRVLIPAAGEIRTRCDAIVEKLELDPLDVRTRSLLHVKQFCASHVVIPMRLYEVSSSSGGKRLLQLLFRASTPGDIDVALDNLLKQNKLAFITSSQFIFEWCMSSMLTRVKGTHEVWGFLKVLRALQDELGIPPNPMGQHLRAAAELRNSLHLAGVHAKRPFRANVGGTLYEFKKGKKAECASWEDVLHLVRHNLDHYETLFSKAGTSEIPFS